jgi:hypothetical protein
MKKFFISLMLGFGAALGVFVALAMPPGGWGVAVGVGLGLLGCLPLLLIMMMLVGRGHTDRRNYAYEEAPQPVIIIQHPGGYDPFNGYVHGQTMPQYLPSQPPPVYPSELEYYAYAEPVRPSHGSSHGLPHGPSRRQSHLQASPPEQDYYRLPSSRRRSQPAQGHYPEQLPGDYYEEEYYEPEPAYYDAPPPQPDRYDAYYGPREDGYYPERPVRTRRNPARVPSRFEATEAEYRAIGESD